MHILLKHDIMKKKKYQLLESINNKIDDVMEARPHIILIL